MINHYGSPPYSIALLHGGPGAAGEMAPLAKMLADEFGVLEPHQTADSVWGQVKELHEQLGDEPRIIVGYSWGAILAYLYAATYPDAVKKVILVGSALFDEKYAHQIEKTRLSRLSEEEQREFKSASLTKKISLISKADGFDTEPIAEEVLFSQEIFDRVWTEAHQMRREGKLLQKRVKCPVVALHGDYDPHPVAGVQEPLEKAIDDFSMIVLPNCGHKPWIEKQIDFVHVLKGHLRS
ncbi:MAG: alpha/beta hydrolase [Chlamydiales bacterium]|nr:alpha/beta hydrolase [Chlamydiales bacterium]